MNDQHSPAHGPTAVSVIMISLNEAHNMEAVLDNLQGWAAEIFLVDSYSRDETVEIALSRGVHVVQRRFRDFGDQWNFALEALPIKTPWTMKLDPDERLPDRLKADISRALAEGRHNAFAMKRRLWFMGKAMPVHQDVLRIWRTGSCRFSDTIVNEHPLVEGPVGLIPGAMEHHDSPDLHHWFAKQNGYLTAEARLRFQNDALAAEPRLFGTAMQRRMWLKKHFMRIPGRYQLLFLYHLVWLGAWRAGKVGWIWAHLRTEVFRCIEFKLYEMRRMGRDYAPHVTGHGPPHPKAEQAE